jgi:hypothetical protein
MKKGNANSHVRAAIAFGTNAFCRRSMRKSAAKDIADSLEALGVTLCMPRR